MKAGPKIPPTARASVAAMVAHRLTDEQIAGHFACTKQTVINFRKAHGVERQSVTASRPAGSPEPIRVYRDEALNHVVKVYPPGASGLPADNWMVYD
ncbi:MAG: hypothetical protein U0835_00320 [Isosphaeraceae bacterium]